MSNPQRVVIENPFKTAFDATLGVIVGLFVLVAGGIVLLGITNGTYSASDVQRVCADHGGVSSIYQDGGLLLPSRLVICHDGTVGAPKHG